MSAALESAPPPKRRARTRQSAAADEPRASTKKAAKKGASERGPGRWLWVIPLLALGLISVLAVLSFDATDDGAYARGVETHNWVGPFGHLVSWSLFHMFGVSAYGAALAIVTAGVLACSTKGLRFAPLATFGWALVGTAVSALAHLTANAANWSYPPGGALGRAVGDAARGVFSITGSFIVLLALLLMAILLATHFAAARAFEAAARGVGHVSVSAAKGAYALYDRHRRARAMRAELEDDDEAGEADDRLEAGEDARYAVEDDEEAPEPAPPRLAPVKPAKAEKKASPEPSPKIVTPPAARFEEGPRLVLPTVPPDSLAEPALEVPKKPRAKKDKAAKEVAGEGASDEPAEAANPAGDGFEIVDEAPVAPAPVTASAAAPPAPVIIEPRAPEAARVPAIIEPKAPPKPVARPPQEKRDWRMKDGKTGFVTPSVDEILEGEPAAKQKIDRLALTATAAKLVQKLNNLGVQGEVTEIRPGPVVTMYEFKPADGIKLSRIASLSDDLAMAMEALSVRIVAPIPGKGVVGFEVPNKLRETVFLKEVVEQEAFQKGASRLTMAIGKDIEGMPYVSDLAKMPHLLIAGTTGSGKSVGVNSMLVSMLMRATPEELRFIMVDPKMLELSIYDGIPHLLLPVVTDPKKAAMALRWGVEEMERRYELLAAAGVRNIGQYNKHVEKEQAEHAARKPVQMELPTVDEDGDPIVIVQSEPPAEPPKKLPYIVIVIDELADLMMVAAKEVEVYIARLAQMARASGIHLMVATQRPSTDVLTGVIKANFPSRISFQVASRHDSGTIINQTGAENLLGMGDMLILPPGTSSLTRVHGAYVSEAEINKLTAFWKAQGAPVYDPEILRPRDEDGGGETFEDEIADELWDQAIAAVSDMKMVSISLLQRKMRIGYNRAARMIEKMEREGIVGPADGAKPREVLIRGIGDEPNL